MERFFRICMRCLLRKSREESAIEKAELKPGMERCEFWHFFMEELRRTELYCYQQVAAVLYIACL